MSSTGAPRDRLQGPRAARRHRRAELSPAWRLMLPASLHPNTCMRRSPDIIEPFEPASPGGCVYHADPGGMQYDSYPVNGAAAAALARFQDFGHAGLHEARRGAAGGISDHTRPAPSAPSARCLTMSRIRRGGEPVDRRSPAGPSPARHGRRGGLPHTASASSVCRKRSANAFREAGRCKMAPDAASLGKCREMRLTIRCAT
jgi:hypothetical protein